jgi:hypothetical protein
MDSNRRADDNFGEHLVAPLESLVDSLLALAVVMLRKFDCLCEIAEDTIGVRCVLTVVG